MEIVIRGDKIKVTQAINDYLKDKLSKLEKYIEDYDNIRATVVVKVKNHEQKVEVTIPLKKFILRAEESKEDLRLKTANETADLKKYLDRIKGYEAKKNEILKNKQQLTALDNSRITCTKRVEELKKNILAKGNLICALVTISFNCDDCPNKANIPCNLVKIVLIICVYPLEMKKYTKRPNATIFNPIKIKPRVTSFS